MTELNLPALPDVDTASDESGPSLATVTVRMTGAERLRSVGKQLLRRPTVVISLVVVLLALLAAAWPSLFTGVDPNATSPDKMFAPPGTGGYLLGSDAVGRDLLTRVVYGARPSLEAACVAILVSFLGGGLFGLLAGYFGGIVDATVMRIVDVILAFPALLFAMAIVAVVGSGPLKIAAAVGAVGIASMARVMRSEVLRVRRQPYVEASSVSGARWWTVLRRHVLPNSIGPITVLAAVEFGTTILSVSSLSFLGFGAPPPSPEWGALISDGRNYLVGAWWLCTIPGLVVAFVVLATNRISRALEGELKA
ncbi:ABC transporter permease [Streptomyces sp. NPDC026665]|uniref:ABC transporter permease n=1 Tax=Streptomyces sp. NPDC026665 TaxID=3154798 RepID=UPI0033F05818